MNNCPKYLKGASDDESCGGGVGWDPVYGVPAKSRQGDLIEVKRAERWLCQISN